MQGAEQPRCGSDKSGVSGLHTLASKAYRQVAFPDAGRTQEQHIFCASYEMATCKLAVLRQIEWSLVGLDRETREERAVLEACRDAISYFEGEQLRPLMRETLMAVGFAVGAACLLAVLIVAASAAGDDNSGAREQGRHKRRSGGGSSARRPTPHQAGPSSSGSAWPGPWYQDRHHCSGSPSVMHHVVTHGGPETPASSKSGAEASGGGGARWSPTAFLDRVPIRAGWEETLSRQR